MSLGRRKIRSEGPWSSPGSGKLFLTPADLSERVKMEAVEWHIRNRSRVESSSDDAARARRRLRAGERGDEHE
ncbi:hypothetical protein LTR39_005561, partial [Cryomyces antarcticus]